MWLEELDWHAIYVIIGGEITKVHTDCLWRVYYYHHSHSIESLNTSFRTCQICCQLRGFCIDLEAREQTPNQCDIMYQTML